MLVVIFQTQAFLSSKDHILNCLYLCRRTGEAYLFRVGIHICSTPFLKIQIGTCVHYSLHVGRQFFLFRRGYRALVFHYAHCISRTAFSGRAVYGHNTWKWSFYSLYAMLKTAFYSYEPIF